MEKVPTPLFSNVMIKNPMQKAMTEALDKELNLLPEKDRNAVLEEKMKTMWGEVRILAVGDTCSTLKKGDSCVATPTAVTQSIPSPGGEYLFVPERAFIAKW